ncbi:hypothetical protein M3Y94_00411200 [Aphelenchoides besseyi]|nr:hypothetical protein M3Y94_00411200 [Aphelenchoides besseyi]
MPGSEKEVKVKTLDFDGFPLTSCTESEWLSARHAYKADQLNVKKSKNRVTAFAANTPEENGNLSSKSEKSVKSTSSNTSSYTSATFTSQEQRSTIPSSVKQKELEDAVIRCTTITSERNIDSGPSTPTMLQVAEDLSSPMAQSKLSKKTF